ncbi:4'-phosphopantetheinyl transferase superfamily protein [Kordia sp. YSTF-M3]|uniref:4'-phosphopantetheinyl transferase superfamily protein n=1 Tax=Kordia aestuariivivens TaxID=2759037 RepID=A0ABR7QDC8_9FLAO|nr:4'-phosphopantetheinyl transferase superfamily protein [Kordia aestuariivivens]MBC8756493.1 4'-phosphopantetheinyl transferase superfamily protein [Kordia aestuariivivens]
MIQILYTFLSKEFYETSLQEQLKIFPNDFTNKICKYKRWQDQQASVLGRLLLIRGIADFYDKQINGSDIGINENGKPFLKDSDIEFNISHSGELVICTIQKTLPVGIDIEEMKEIQIEDFFYQMTENESATIKNSTDQKRAFYNYWTQKEAVLKANGKGLSVPLKSFEIIENQTQLYKDEWYVSKLSIHPEYSCHMAAKQKSKYIIYYVDHREINTFIEKVN